MNLKRIVLNNFRNYEHLDLEFHKKVNIIIGKNAQGKTNIIEAIYIMSLGKSFRTGRDSEMILFDAPYARAKSITLKDDENLELEIIITKEGKSVKINRMKTTKSSDILENLYIVIFSPEDLKIIKDEPEKRRKFMDRELCQLRPVYFKNLSRYKKILLQRNALLKKQDINKELLSVWNEEIVEYGSKIILQRKEFLKKINKISGEIHKKITDGKEEILISYESNIPLKNDHNAQKEEFMKCILKSVEKDIFRRTTTTGPQKDDIKITINDIDIRHYGSQGQQRTAALSLKLAEIQLIREETGEDAILLLDDVLSELDLERQSFLINSLNDVQLFITTTEIGDDLKTNLPEGFTFYVKDGKAEKIICEDRKVK